MKQHDTWQTRPFIYLLIFHVFHCLCLCSGIPSTGCVKYLYSVHRGANPSSMEGVLDLSDHISVNNKLVTSHDCLPLSIEPRLCASLPPWPIITTVPDRHLCSGYLIRTFSLWAWKLFDTVQCQERQKHKNGIHKILHFICFCIVVASVFG